MRLPWKRSEHERISRAVLPAGYYGDGGTIHSTGHIDVAVDKDGIVREVMFRCKWLPFNQVSFEELRQGGDQVPVPETRIKGIITENNRSAVNHPREPFMTAPPDTVSIGPECFASADGQVICWKGVNYLRQEITLGLDLP